jgi:hypothetical protein
LVYRWLAELRKNAVISGSPSHGQEIDGESGAFSDEAFRSGSATVSFVFSKAKQARSPA